MDNWVWGKFLSADLHGMHSENDALILDGVIAIHRPFRTAAPKKGAAARAQSLDGSHAVSHVASGMRIAALPDISRALSFGEMVRYLPVDWSEGSIGHATEEQKAMGKKVQELYDFVCRGRGRE